MVRLRLRLRLRLRHRLRLRVRLDGCLSQEAVRTLGVRGDVLGRVVSGGLVLG